MQAPGAAPEDVRLIVERSGAAAGLDVLVGADNAGLLSLGKWVWIFTSL